MITIDLVSMQESDYVAEQLWGNNTEEELFELITLIDSNVSEYDFTKKLYNYFKEQYKNDKADKKRNGIA